MAMKPFEIAALALAGILAATAAPAVDMGGSSEAAAPATSDLAKARAQVEKADYAAAIVTLKAIVATDKGNADAWNLLGYSSRKLKHYDEAADYYQTALKLDPDHLGALEYQGELFLETGQGAKAKANLARLTKLCGDCEEAEDLREALERAGQS
jgi:Flp pilus assembly protein TadD